MSISNSFLIFTENKTWNFLQIVWRIRMKCLLFFYVFFFCLLKNHSNVTGLNLATPLSVGALTRSKLVIYEEPFYYKSPNCDMTKSILWYHKIDFVISLIIMCFHKIDFVISHSKAEFVISLKRISDITNSVLKYHNWAWFCDITNST